MKPIVAVLGSGSWGSTFAALTTRNASVLLWARDPEVAAEINASHSNTRYLPGLSLPKRLRASTSLAETVAEADAIVIAVPSHGFRRVVEQAAPHLRPGVPILSLSKGLEHRSNLRMTEIIGQVLPGHPPAVLSGPNLAHEILSGQAAASVLAMTDGLVLRQIQPLFNSGLFRVYSNTDVIGCELGGVLKNVVAIACGMSDAMGAGDNTRAAIMTRGLAEMTRLGVALGGSAATFAGLAGMGDLVTTCTSPLSRNRHVGEQLGLGRDLASITTEMRMIAEGVKSTPVAVALADAHNIEVPLLREVNRILEGGSTRRALRTMMKIAAGAEHEPG